MECISLQSLGFAGFENEDYGAGAAVFGLWVEDALADAVLKPDGVYNLRTDYAPAARGMQAFAGDDADFEKAPGVAVLHKGDCSGDGVFKSDTV